MFSRRAVFIDRDGTVVEAIKRPDFPKQVTAAFKENELRFFHGVKEDLERLKDAGYLRIMVTNQPDVKLGYLSEDEWKRIHGRIIAQLPFDDVFMCRHTSADGCPFKKPSGLMLRAAADKWGIDLVRSYMIGDTDADMGAGDDADCQTILLARDYNQDIRVGRHTLKDFRQAVNEILWADKVFQGL